MNNKGPLQISIEVQGLDQLVAQFSRSPDIVAKHTAKALMEAAIFTQGKIRDETPVFEDRLRNSIMFARLGAFSVRVYTNVKYAVYVHEGTRPHAAPMEPIKRWADKKGIPAGAVWWQIFHHGTKANPFFKRGASKAEPGINRIFDKTLDRVANDLGA